MQIYNHARVLCWGATTKYEPKRSNGTSRGRTISTGEMEVGLETLVEEESVIFTGENVPRERQCLGGSALNPGCVT
jgi:hypothetical protein